MTVSKRSRRNISPTRRIVLGFALIILIGAVLLAMPFSQRGGRMNFTDALFTSISATCVTGLVRADTAMCFNTVGQSIILVLIQIGGVGFMTIAVMLLSSFRRSLSVSDKMTLAESYGLSSVGGIVPIMKRVAAGTAVFEAVGAGLLAFRFVPIFGFGEGLRQSVFHSVSAFCNAGFDILGTTYGEYSGMTAFVGDPLVMLTLSALIVIGGIGFIVWDDIWQLVRRKQRISVYSKIVLTASAVLLAAGAVLFAAAEWNNPGTIGELGIPGKIITSTFQSATARTAGFSAVDMTLASESTKFMFLFLMFVGGSAGSTAGGIKTATAVVILFTLLSFMRGRKKTNILGRTVPYDTVHRAFAVTAIQFVITMLASAVLIAEGQELMAALFECVSASATVGLSLSLTPSLPLLSELAVMLLMFLGRVGIMTFAYSLKKRAANSEFETEYARANIMIG